MERYPPLEVKVWGDYACFTRPEMKVERASYPVITPSAARGVLEAIFWKPQFQWRVFEVVILSPIRFMSILRNEVNSRASDRSAKGWQNRGGGYFATEDRAQRNSLILRDVAYIIRADVHVFPWVKDAPAKFRDQFRRRVDRGQFYHCPYLGCREFAANFSAPSENDIPEPINENLGRILFDISFEHNEQGLGIRGTPLFFNAEIRNGVLNVPQGPYNRMEVGHVPETTG